MIFARQILHTFFDIRFEITTLIDLSGFNRVRFRLRQRQESLKLIVSAELKRKRIISKVISSRDCRIIQRLPDEIIFFGLHQRNLISCSVTYDEAAGQKFQLLAFRCRV